MKHERVPVGAPSEDDDRLNPKKLPIPPACHATSGHSPTWHQKPGGQPPLDASMEEALRSSEGDGWMNAPRGESGILEFSVRPDGAGWIEGSAGAGAGAGEEAQPFAFKEAASQRSLRDKRQSEQSRAEESERRRWRPRPSRALALLQALPHPRTASLPSRSRSPLLPLPLVPPAPSADPTMLWFGSCGTGVRD